VLAVRRGLHARQEARAILVRAFLAEALDPVTNDTARGLLEDAVARWWEGQTL